MDAQSKEEATAQYGEHYSIPRKVTDVNTSNIPVAQGLGDFRLETLKDRLFFPSIEAVEQYLCYKSYVDVLESLFTKISEKKNSANFLPSFLSSNPRLAKDKLFKSLSILERHLETMRLDPNATGPDTHDVVQQGLKKIDRFQEAPRRYAVFTGLCNHYGVELPEMPTQSKYKLSVIPLPDFLQVPPKRELQTVFFVSAVGEKNKAQEWKIEKRDFSYLNVFLERAKIIKENAEDVPVWHVAYGDVTGKPDSILDEEKLPSHLVDKGDEDQFYSDKSSWFAFKTAISARRYIQDQARCSQESAQAALAQLSDPEVRADGLQALATVVPLHPKN